MRIVAGKLKGLKLNEFELDNIRPTIDRVRESIFNKIQFNIFGSEVLDLFGGTGAVSLEFVSRGAKNVITVDNNKNSIKLIKQNFMKAKVTPNLYEMDFKLALEKLNGRKFDFIFLDPPFESSFGNQSLEYIAKHDMLNDGGVIVYEFFADTEVVVPDELLIKDEKKYGTIKVMYLEKSNG